MQDVETEIEVALQQRHLDDMQVIRLQPHRGPLNLDLHSALYSSGNFVPRSPSAAETQHPTKKSALYHGGGGASANVFCNSLHMALVYSCHTIPQPAMRLSGEAMEQDSSERDRLSIRPRLGSLLARYKSPCTCACGSSKSFTSRLRYSRHCKA